MRHYFYLFLLPFVGASAFGQAFVLEHYYPEGIAQRVNLEYSGEKYVVLDVQENKVNLYNPDHSLWKSVKLTPPGGVHAGNLRFVSEALINPDPALEIAYSYFSNTPNPLPTTIIVSEDGTVLKPPTYNTLNFSIEEGLEPKLISTWAETHIRIYKLQSLVLENSFTGYLSRVLLEVSGEKYFEWTNGPSISARFLNADLTPWKTIPLPVPEGVTDATVRTYSEQEFNNDALMEILYTYIDPQTNTRITQLINENGVVLLTIPDSYGYFYVDKRQGLEDKLMFEKWLSEGQYQTLVYSLGTFTLEHTYSGYARRANLERSGEKYFTQHVNQEAPERDAVTIYNADHTFWKKILLPVPTPTHYVQYVESISQTLFVADAQVEVSYRCEDHLPQTYDAQQACIANESENILLAVPHAYEIIVDQTAGFEPKIIARLYRNGGSTINTNFETEIYKIDNTTGVCGQDAAQLVLYPNPAAETLLISNECPIVIAQIYSVTGALVKTESAAMLESIDVSSLASGLYMIRLTNSSGLQSTRKLMVTH